MSEFPLQSPVTTKPRLRRCDKVRLFMRQNKTPVLIMAARAGDDSWGKQRDRMRQISEYLNATLRYYTRVYRVVADNLDA